MSRSYYDYNLGLCVFCVVLFSLDNINVYNLCLSIHLYPNNRFKHAQYTFISRKKSTQKKIQNKTKIKERYYKDAQGNPWCCFSCHEKFFAKSNLNHSKDFKNHKNRTKGLIKMILQLNHVEKSIYSNINSEITILVSIRNEFYLKKIKKVLPSSFWIDI